MIKVSDVSACPFCLKPLLMSMSISYLECVYDESHKFIAYYNSNYIKYISYYSGGTKFFYIDYDFELKKLELYNGKTTHINDFDWDINHLLSPIEAKEFYDKIMFFA